MGRTYTNLREIPIPQFAKVNRANDTVYVILNSRNSRGDFRRRNIGKRASSGTMYANDNFRRYYPDLWNSHYGERMNAKEDFLHAGMYVASLAMMNKNGLYEAMLDSYGPKAANALSDFAMYSILNSGDAAMNFTSSMEMHMLFSQKAYSDSWYSDLFHEMKSSDHAGFLDRWMDRCRKKGLEDVWLCIDGSNNECFSEASSLAVNGHSKAGRSGNIVSYMYAVDSRDGTPVTYQAYYGSIVDKTAFMGIMKFLSSRNVTVRGVILDRGFCTKDVTETVKGLGMSYVIMTNSNTVSYTYMMEKHAEEIRWNTERLVNRKGIFGIKDRTKPFSGSDEECYAYLFYDAGNGTERSLRLISNVMDARDEALKAAREGKGPSFPSTVSRFLYPVRDEKGSISDIAYRHDEWNREISGKGYSLIISSEDLDPAEVDRLYNLRDVSEKVYAMVKTQLGFSVTRTSGDDAILSKMALMFISAILRQEFVNTAKRIRIPTNVMIAELNKMHVVLGPSGDYALPHKESGKAGKFLECHGVNTEIAEAIICDYNGRDREHSLERRLPEAFEKRKQGRPKAEATADPEAVPAQPPRKRGRPKGSKNRKTLERERMALMNAGATSKRGRGRPRKDGT